MKTKRSRPVAVDGVVTQATAFATIATSIFDKKKYNTMDFVYTKANELAVVSYYGLYLYDYHKDRTMHYFNIGRMVTIDTLDQRRVVLGGLVDDRHSIVVFDHIAKEIVDIRHTKQPLTKIKKISPDLLVCIGDCEEIYFLDCHTLETVHIQPTTDHEGNIEHGWVSSVEIVDDDVIVYGGSDCKLSFFNHQKMQLEYEVSRPGWIRDIIVFENKLVATDGGSDKFAVWDYINKEYLYNKRTPRDNWVKKLCYAGDGDIVFSPDCDWVFNLKSMDIHKVNTIGEEHEIRKRIASRTDVTQNMVCFKDRWLRRHAKAIPFSFGISKIFVTEENLLYFVSYKRLSALDWQTKKISEPLNLPFSQFASLRINDHLFAFVAGEFPTYTFIIYDLNLKKIVHSRIIESIGDICKLDDNTLVVPHKDRLSLFNLKRYTYTFLKCIIAGNTFRIKRIVALDKKRIALLDSGGIRICNTKTMETSRGTDMDISDHIIDFVILDQEYLALTKSFYGIYVVNYNTQEIIAQYPHDTKLQYIDKIDEETVVVIDELYRILFFNYKQRKIVRKIEHYGPSGVESVITLPDRRIAVITWNSVDIYDNLENWQCETSIKMYRDDIVKIEDYLQNEATLIHPVREFRKPPEIDPVLESHIAFYDPKTGTVTPYSENMEAVQFVEDDPRKVVVPDWKKV